MRRAFQRRRAASLTLRLVRWVRRVGIGIALATAAAGAAVGFRVLEKGGSLDETTLRPDTAAAVTTTVPPALRSFTIAATGDLLIHQPVAARARVYGRAAGVAYDFGPMFSPVAPVLSAGDFAICHLETPLGPGPVGSYPLFNAPPELAVAIAAAGYDACSTASNHSMDRGEPGVWATLTALDAAGVSHAGTARTPEERAVPRIQDAAGVRIGRLSYSYGFNGLVVPPDKPWLANALDPAIVLKDAALLKQAGAEFVVVSLHWGVEYQTGASPEQRVLADVLLASPDIDLILGHHAHVVLPVESIRGEYVAYGLGNFLSNQDASCCPAATQDGVVLLFTVAETSPGTFSVAHVTHVPTFVEPGSYRILPVGPALADPATPPWIRRQLEASWARTTAVLGQP